MYAYYGGIYGFIFVEVFSPFQCGGIVDGVGWDGEEWVYVFIFCEGGFF